MIVKKIKMLITVITIVLSFTTTGFLFSMGKNKKTGTITGTLSDIYTRQPLAGADVILVGTQKVTISDMAGGFTFKNVLPGSYALKFNLPGMQPQVKTDIIVKPQRTVTVNASIQLITLVSEAVEVSAGYFTRTPEKPGNSISFSSEEIRRAPGSAGDISRIISSLPSIAKVSDQANNLVVRGGSTHENLFLVDNIQIQNINHFPFQGTSGGAVSLINVDFIEDVEFFSGGFSAIYGDRLSSVMNLRLREGDRKRFNGQLSLDFSGAGVSLEGPLTGSKTARMGESRGSWMVSARRSYVDLLAEIMDAGAAVKYSDLQGKLVYDLSPRSKLTLLGVLGLDKSKVTRDNARDLGESIFGDAKNRQHTVGLNWFWMWNDKGYSDTSLSHSFTRYDYNFRKTAADTAYLENVSQECGWQMRNVNHWNLNHTHTFRFGFGAQRNSSRYNYVMAPYRNLLGQQVAESRKQVDVSATKASLFAEYTLTPVPEISMNFGLRADHFSYTGRTLVSPRASVRVQVSPRTSLSAAVGIYRQNLPLLLLYRNKENKSLHEPLALQYSFGFSHLIGQAVRLNIEGYYKNYDNFPIDPQRRSLSLLDDLFGFSLFGDKPLTDKGKARSYGVEFVLQKKMKENFYGMISGSWFRSQYSDSEGHWRNRVFDNRYIFAVQGGYKPDRNWEYSTRWIVAGGMPYTPFDIKASEAGNSGIYDQTKINGKRMPAYHSLNLRLDRRFYFSGSNLTAYLSIWNAYNHKNTATYYWNEIENKPDFSYQFSILPVFGLEFEF